MARAKSECTCINLRRAANAITDYYDRLLKPCGLTVSQFSLIANIDRIGICSISELAKYVGLERTTLARSLQPLILNKLVEDISPVGTRNCQIKVTPAGFQALEKGKPLWKEAQDGVKAKIGEDNIALLMHLLSLVEDL